MLFPQLVHSRKTFFVWLGLIWPTIDLVVLIAAWNFCLNARVETECGPYEKSDDASIKEQVVMKCSSLNGRSFAPLIFGAFAAVTPWLRMFGVFRFYITVLLQTFFRGVMTFIIMFICCLTWTLVIYYRQEEEGVHWLTLNESWHRSWAITWGEDLTGWLYNEPSHSWKLINIMWSLLAFLVFVNIMIAVSGAVFSETREEWVQGDLEVKNEFIL